MLDGHCSSPWVCLKPGFLKDEFNTWFTLPAVGKSASSCRCQQTLLQLLCFPWVLAASHNVFLVKKGRSSMACLISDSSTVCLVSCVSFSLFSLTAYPVTQQDMLIVNTQFLSIFYEKLSKTSKMYVKKSISVPWTSDGSDLICCPPGCLEQGGGNTGKALMEIHKRNKAEATWLSCCLPVLLPSMFLP